MARRATVNVLPVRPVAAFFCMPEAGHFKLLLPLLADLVESGFDAHVFTHTAFEREVGQAGATFIDLFEKYPLEDADNESIPIPSRYVSYSCHFAEEVAREVGALQPSLIIYETFAVIGRLIGMKLHIPYVNVSPGHALDPSRVLPLLQRDPRVKTSTACHRAVAILKDHHGMEDASPFSYVSGLSPFLNVCCEPEAFLDPEEWSAFEPRATYGSLPLNTDTVSEPNGIPPSPKGASSRSPGSRSYPGNKTKPDASSEGAVSNDSPNPTPFASKLSTARTEKYFDGFGGGAERLKVYISFGTVVWRYFAPSATRALETICECLEASKTSCAIVSLGGSGVGTATIRSMSRPNIRVMDFVDQHQMLAEADAFVTHHGVNSTHEAIFHRVPMLSCPFFWDQPALAARCQQLGLAIPLTGDAREGVTKHQVVSALLELSEKRSSILTRLEQAHTWEMDVIRNRPRVLETIRVLAMR